jgi:small membrane protein
MYVQVILGIFIIFALSRVILQVKSTKLTLTEFIFWASLFIFALVGVIDPGLTSYVANLMGIGRGVDIAIYISIIILFYLIFRLSIALEETRREISELVRKIALNDKSIIKTSQSKQIKPKRLS